jgi:hypothetical protein
MDPHQPEKPMTPDEEAASSDSHHPDGPPISPQVPGRMHRAEDNEEAFRKSPEYTDRKDGVLKDSVITDGTDSGVS